MNTIVDLILTGIGNIKIDVLTAISGILTLCLIIVCLMAIISIIQDDESEEETK